MDEDTRDVFGPTPGETRSIFRLDEREAIVILGLLPPPGAYFGIQTYVYSREETVNTEDPIYQSVDDPFMKKWLFPEEQNATRMLMVASIGDSNNNVVIERQSGSAFDEQRYFIITPDAVMEQEVTAALLRADVPDRNQVFTEPVSPEVVRLGLGAEADELMVLGRYALPEDLDSGEVWRQEISMAILRVRDADIARDTEPFTRPEYEEKTAVSELGYESDLAALVEAVKQQWQQTAAPDGEFQSLRTSVDLVGQDCLERPMNCLGDTPDADYQVSPTVTIDLGEVLALVGTLATATDNATYVSVSVNRIEVLMGVANINNDQLDGTASEFSDTVANTDMFYLQYLVRDCSGITNCFEISEQLVPPEEGIKVIQRNYVVPGSTRGPDPGQVLNPVLIVFDGNARP